MSCQEAELAWIFLARARQKSVRLRIVWREGTRKDGLQQCASAGKSLSGQTPASAHPSFSYALFVNVCHWQRWDAGDIGSCSGLGKKKSLFSYGQQAILLLTTLRRIRFLARNSRK